MKRGVIVVATAIAMVSVVGCQIGCDDSTTACPPEFASVYSPCGFQSATTTCPAISCAGSTCKITSPRAVSCEISMVLGDGTARVVPVTFVGTSNGADRCPSRCGEVRPTFGGDAGAVSFTFPESATCGGDAGRDSGTD